MSSNATIRSVQRGAGSSDAKNPGPAVIGVVAAIICNGRGEILLVRKRNTTVFMQPGGKREPGEDDLDAMARELHEELGCHLIPGSAIAHGTFEAPAAHEPASIVRAAIYSVKITDDITCQAEIVETIWLDPAASGDWPLAPLTQDAVLPIAREMGKALQAR